MFCQRDKRRGKEMAVKVERCHLQAVWQLGCSSGATDSMQVNASSRAATAAEGGNRFVALDVALFRMQD